ncbi:MAG: hypothetical protein KatS3mg050_2365 [Litorilinea sp.]|nr:MAG: hypothetical protein KatS3mg050_2365 [Litorilinea sp.]
MENRDVPEKAGQLPPEKSTSDGETKRWSRRFFLSGMASGAAALWMAACRRSSSPSADPTATATPVSRSSPLSPAGSDTLDHRAYLPLVSKDGAPAEAALLPDPTETPTPTQTPAPPTPTPTPVATPFPPGPPSKLGIHVERNLPQLFDLLATQAVTVVTTLELDPNFAAQIKSTSPRTRLIGRIHVEQANLAQMDPMASARAFVEQLLPYADDPRRRPYFDGWISFNEPVAANPDEMKRLADFEAERTRLLGERGIRSVIGNFGTGQPTGEQPFELWPYFFPALQAAQEYDGWLGLHEYSAPTIYYLTTRQDQGRYPGISPEDTGWLTLRYRQVYRQILQPNGLAIPLVMTELGVDGLVSNRPGPPDAHGWQDFQEYWRENGYGLWGPGAYIEQLVWYDEAMRQDDYVIGGCIYGLGTSARWLSYDISGPAAAVLQQYLSVHAPV